MLKPKEIHGLVESITLPPADDQKRGITIKISAANTPTNRQLVAGLVNEVKIVDRQTKLEFGKDEAA